MRFPTQSKLICARETALIVNPQPSERQLLARYFAQANYYVLSANSGDEALEVCRSHEGAIHVLVTDVDSGDWKLAEAAAGIRPGLLVLFLSSARLGNAGSELIRGKTLLPGGPDAVQASMLLAVTRALTHRAPLGSLQN